MPKKKFLIVGSGGRESAFALHLLNDSIIFAIVAHKNPTILKCVEKSGGNYIIDNPSSPNVVLSFAKTHKIDYAFINADEPLSKGVVDILLQNNIKAIGGTKEGTRIEWDKVYAIEMMRKINPNTTPYFKVVTKKEALKNAIKNFEEKNLEIVIKPQGLTGGKGVKVMPIHLKNYQACWEYATELLEKKEKVLLVEKLNGIEFTIMGITDGKNLVLAPATYDYPYRLEGDKGVGTGGMGCFTNKEKKLPFLNDTDWEVCQMIMQNVLDEMRKNNIVFNGVINGGFFKTKKGIRFMEFNSRFGDPEGLNILSVLKTPLSEVLINIANQSLHEKNIQFISQTSVVKYLVAKEYPNASNEEIYFSLDEKNIEKMGVQLIFASCEKVKENHYKTLKKSRVVAFVATGEKIENASAKINSAIDTYFKGNLEYRKDIGTEKSLEKLK